jgi:hypothetical protein
MALAPPEVFEGSILSARDKAYTYSQKATCLKDYSKVFEEQKDEEASGPNRRLYRFFLEIAPQALELYEKWKAHQGFQGSGLRSLERDGMKIVEVPDGIVFPILASFSVFAKQTKNGWRVQQPKQLSDSELVAAAKVAYMQIAGSNPQTMGKRSACYSQLLQLTTVYNKLIN